MSWVNSRNEPEEREAAVEPPETGGDKAVGKQGLCLWKDGLWKDGLWKGVNRDGMCGRQLQVLFGWRASASNRNAIKLSPAL